MAGNLFKQRVLLASGVKLNILTYDAIRKSSRPAQPFALNRREYRQESDSFGNSRLTFKRYTLQEESLEDSERLGREYWAFVAQELREGVQGRRMFKR